MTPLPARLRSAQALAQGRSKALLLALALLALFNLWLLAFSLDLGLTTAATWWALALAGSLAGLGISVITPGAWPLALAAALGTTAAMRSYFALTTAAVTLPSLVAFGLAAGFIAATLSALGQRRALRGLLVLLSLLVVLLVLGHAFEGRWSVLWRQLLHLVAICVLASAVDGDSGHRAHGDAPPPRPPRPGGKLNGRPRHPREHGCPSLASHPARRLCHAGVHR